MFGYLCIWNSNSFVSSRHSNRIIDCIEWVDIGTLFLWPLFCSIVLWQYCVFYSKWDSNWFLCVWSPSACAGSAALPRTISVQKSQNDFSIIVRNFNDGASDLEIITQEVINGTVPHFGTIKGESEVFPNKRSPFDIIFNGRNNIWWTEWVYFNQKKWMRWWPSSVISGCQDTETQAAKNDLHEQHRFTCRVLLLKHLAAT